MLCALCPVLCALCNFFHVVKHCDSVVVFDGEGEWEKINAFGYCRGKSLVYLCSRFEGNGELNPADRGAAFG